MHTSKILIWTQAPDKGDEEKKEKKEKKEQKEGEDVPKFRSPWHALGSSTIEGNST